MSFFELQIYKRTSIIQKKQRICLIVQYSIDSFFIFYKDQSFQQINNHNNQIVNQGKLSFLPFQSLYITHNHRIVLLGIDKDKNLCCGLIDVQNQCQIENRQMSNASPEKTTQFYIYESEPNKQANFYIIMIQKNIQNGLAIAAYDFENNLWCDQMLGLPSKFLNYFYINTAISNNLYKQQSQKQQFTFALAALGDKFDSINYSKIKMNHQYRQAELILKISFIITRQVKLKSHFVIMGGYQCQLNTLMLVGNSKQQTQNSIQFINVPAYVVLDTHKIENNQPQEIRAYPMLIKKYAQRIYDLHLRGVIGLFEGNLICELRYASKQKCIVRVNLHHQQQITEMAVQKTFLSLSVKKDCLFSYVLDCQYFFEKIKGSPSKIDMTILKICDKKYQYRYFVKKVYPELTSQFIQDIQCLL